MPSIERTELADVLTLHPDRHDDERGWVFEVFRASLLAEQGVTVHWVQENRSFSKKRGTVRGLHFQAPPSAQAKLVRVTRGAVLDVMLDLRRNSPTFGRFVACELNAENGVALYAPIGFAHGFCTLADDTEIAYLMSAEYAPATEGGVLWSDPALAIAWPVKPEDAIVSGKDRNLPLLKDAELLF